jgi:hypothetical protein
MLRILTPCVLLTMLAGCGGSTNEALVSGTITVNGKPAPGLHVSFQPIGSKDNPNPGRGSTGQTDAKGRYTLRIDGQRDGAVVAEHRVAISTVLKGEGAKFDPETGTPDGWVPPTKERIPAEYNDYTTLRFTVPAAGTDKADFDLKIKGYR